MKKQELCFGHAFFNHRRGKKSVRVVLRRREREVMITLEAAREEREIIVRGKKMFDLIFVFIPQKRACRVNQPAARFDQAGRAVENLRLGFNQNLEART